MSKNETADKAPAKAEPKSKVKIELRKLSKFSLLKNNKGVK